MGAVLPAQNSMQHEHIDLTSMVFGGPWYSQREILLLLCFWARVIYRMKYAVALFEPFSWSLLCLRSQGRGLVVLVSSYGVERACSLGSGFSGL